MDGPNIDTADGEHNVDSVRGRAVWTAGYAGHRSADLLRLVEHHDVIVMDIRLSPRSRVPSWNKGPLAQLLGRHYQHVPELGNLNYKTGGPVEIADLETGLQIVTGSERAPLLLCVCAEVSRCHRKVIAEHLIARGWEANEWTWVVEAPSRVQQLALTLGLDRTERDAS